MVAEELCLELAKGVLPVLEESTDPALMELAKGVLLPLLEETTDPALLLFGLEKAKGVLEDRASFLLILDPATWWVVLVPLVEMLEEKDLTEPPANGPRPIAWPMVGLA